MSKIKRNFLIVTAFALFYIAIFVPPNLQCSENPNMLVCAGTDEYAQYPYLMSMTLPDKTFVGTIKKAIDHKHYYYGYPFYFVSALAIAPIRIPRALSIIEGGNFTRTYMLVLRELSPIFMAGTLMLLVTMWTRFESLPASLSLFVFLAAVPTAFWNNMWWHPDSMVTFFVIATLFCLNQDNLTFGKWFYLSAITCGIAVSTKVLGLFFVVCIPTYLVLGIKNDQIKLSKAVQKGAAFFSIMVVTVLLTYPLLLFPGKAEEIFDVLKNQSEMNNFGWGVKMENGPIAHYSTHLRDGFGFWPIYLLSLIIGIVGIFTDRRRLILNVITLTWSATFLAYLLFVVARHENTYYIPALLPLFALIWNIFHVPIPHKARKAIIAAVLFVIAIQFSLYIESDIHAYTKSLSEEKNSPAIKFYRDLVGHNILSEDPAFNGRIYRDTNVYLPPQYNQQASFQTTYYSVAVFDPELILFSREKIDNYSNPQFNDPDNNFSRDLVVLRLELYGDAKNNQIEGFREVFRDDFGVAFERRGDVLIPSVNKGSAD
jgi:hypothetical protein